MFNTLKLDSIDFPNLWDVGSHADALPAINETYLTKLLHPFNDWEYSLSSGAFTALVEIPGCKKKDTTIELSADKKSITINSIRTIHSKTISVIKSLTVPAGVYFDDIKATLEDGVLTITIPKSIEPPLKSTKINIS